jgi:sphinganine-1-phosphate aldolase
MDSSAAAVLCIVAAVSPFLLFSSYSRQPTLFRRYRIQVVRLARPYFAIIGFLLWTVHRAHSGSSLLTMLNDTILWLRDQGRIAFATADTGRIDSLSRTVRGICELALLLVADVVAISGCLALARIIYCLINYSKKEWEMLIVDTVFEWSRHHIPLVRNEIARQLARVAQESHTLFKKDPNRTILLEIPAIGRAAKDVIRELQDFATNENQCWRDGQLSGTVYANDAAQTELMNAVYSLYTWSNPLHPGCWPKINQCEAEVAAMVAQFLHAPATGAGTMTSGGTESIILAVRASLLYFGHGISHPEIVCGSTAHAGLNKACEMFGVRQVVIDCDDGSSYQLNPEKVARAVTPNTILIYASAPCYPQGVVDPIVDLGRVAYRYGVGLHVDGCLGGFVLAFLPDAPVFDFRAEGVTSISIDTHKYGYASKGTSVVVYRTKELRSHQFFNYAHWSGGIYSTPTLAGSRPGALSACAWAALVSTGVNGYQARAGVIVATARAIATAVRDSIPELFLLTNQQPFMVVCIGSHEIDIYRVRDVMNTTYGWQLNALQFPPCIHFCVTMNLEGHAHQFIGDLKASVRITVNEQQQHGGMDKKSGTAGVYGSVGSVPSGPISCILGAYTDEALSA